MNAVQQPELELPLAESPRPAMSSSELWPVAVHEAGHAVAHVYYRIPFRCLLIEPNGDGWVKFDMDKHKALLKSHPRIRYPSKLIVTSYSGFIVHRRVFPSVSRSGMEADEEQVAGLLYSNFKYERILDKATGVFRCPTDAEIEIIADRRARRLWRITQRLMRGLFPVIQAVARALLDRKEMSGEEVEALAGPLIAKEQAAWTKPSSRKPHETLD